MLVDFNHGSGFVYGRDASDAEPLGARINGRIDAALEAEREGQRPRDYLGASRIGEPCARRLVYEVTRTPPDPGKDFEGRVLAHLRGRACLRGSGDPLAPAGRIRSAHADASWRPVRFRDGGRAHSRPC